MKKFQANAKLQSKQRYHNDIEYQNRTKNRSKKTIIDRYATDEEYKEPLRGRVWKGMLLMKNTELTLS